MGLRIRAAKLDDAPSMAKLMVDTWLAAHRGHMPESLWEARRSSWTYEDSEASWRRTIEAIRDGLRPNDRVLVALRNTQLVGIAACSVSSTTKSMTVGALYVSAEVQRQKIGSRLLSVVRSIYSDLGFEAMEIGVLAANAPARAFYESMDGRLISERMFDEEGTLLLEVVYGWNLND